MYMHKPREFFWKQNCDIKRRRLFFLFLPGLPYRGLKVADRASICASVLVPTFSFLIVLAGVTGPYIKLFTSGFVSHSSSTFTMGVLEPSVFFLFAFKFVISVPNNRFLDSIRSHNVAGSATNLFWSMASYPNHLYAALFVSGVWVWMYSIENFIRRWARLEYPKLCILYWLRNKLLIVSLPFRSNSSRKTHLQCRKGV